MQKMDVGALELQNLIIAVYVNYVIIAVYVNYVSQCPSYMLNK